MYYSIIDTLYSGELSPWELMPPPGKYKKSVQAFDAMSEKFTQTLSQKQQEEFEAIIKDNIADYIDILKSLELIDASYEG